MERRLGPIGPSWSAKFFWDPFCVENAIWLLGFWCGRVLSVRRKTGAALSTLYFPFSLDNSEIPATPWM